jgi:hypothetical protein
MIQLQLNSRKSDAIRLQNHFAALPPRPLETVTRLRVLGNQGNELVPLERRCMHAGGTICTCVSDGCFLRPYACRRFRAGALKRCRSITFDTGTAAGRSWPTERWLCAWRLLSDLRQHGVARDWHSRIAADPCCASTDCSRMGVTDANLWPKPANIALFSSSGSASRLALMVNSPLR